jgi:hypothetical protein
MSYFRELFLGDYKNFYIFETHVFCHPPMPLNLISIDEFCLEREFFVAISWDVSAGILMGAHGI